MFKNIKNYLVIFFMFYFLGDIFASGKDSNLINVERKIIKYAKSKRKNLTLKLQELIKLKESITINLLSNREKSIDKNKTNKIAEKNKSEEYIDPVVAEYKEKINLETENFINKKPVLKIKDIKDKLELNEIKNLYDNFILNFKSKNFVKCKDLLSKSDIEKIREEINLSKSEISIDEFIELNIKNMWKRYYDPLFKNDLIFNLKKNFNLYSSDMKKEINILKGENKIFEAEKIEQEIEYEKKKLRSEILFLKAKIEPFGEILDYCIFDKKVILLVNFRYNFLNVEEVIDIRDLIKMQNFQFVNFIEPNILDIYNFMFFVKEQNNWKISLFSQDAFLNENFTSFLNKYKN